MELRPERFELAEALEGVHNLIQPLARKKQQTTALNVDQAIGEVYHDPGRFKQIMYNLLSNAVKFTPDGGKVTTTATSLPGELLEIGKGDLDLGTAVAAETLSPQQIAGLLLTLLGILLGQSTVDIRKSSAVSRTSSIA